MRASVHCKIQEKHNLAATGPNINASKLSFNSREPSTRLEYQDPKHPELEIPLGDDRKRSATMDKKGDGEKRLTAESGI